MKYLDKCATLEELKKAYRAWTKKLHPDCGGSTEEMKVLNLEFEQMFNLLKDKHNATADEKHKVTECPEEFIEIMSVLSGLSGLDIELCGSWLWISGETYQHKAALKAAGCKWSKNKAKWYWRHEEDSGNLPFKRKTMSMSYIRMKYGSERITWTPDPQLNPA